MTIDFRAVEFPGLRALTVSGLPGAAIGLVGGARGGAAELLRAASGGSRRHLAPSDPLDLAPVDLLCLDNSLAQLDALERAKAIAGIGRLRRGGAVILIRSHDEHLLRTVCDEIWWLEEGRLMRRGDPREVLDAYAARVAEQFRAWGEGQSGPLEPALRRGDGRAEIVSIETAGESGKPAMVWASGEQARVRVAVRYREAAANPVLGILIRTRIGFDVYGTNTELEKTNLGPAAAGQTLRVEFRFRCDLCPGEYTLTAASHDPDGVAHDWMDDAVAFLVTDSRYTAGVANLRARVFCDLE